MLGSNAAFAFCPAIVWFGSLGNAPLSPAANPHEKPNGEKKAKTRWEAVQFLLETIDFSSVYLAKRDVFRRVQMKGSKSIIGCQAHREKGQRRRDRSHEQHRIRMACALYCQQLGG